MGYNSLRFLPHSLNTRFHAVKTYRSGNSIDFVCRRYKISSSSLMRWNKKFDGTKESLKDKSHAPKTKNQNSHTEEEIRNIKNYLKRNSNISILELYFKLKEKKGYKRHISSLYRIIKKMNLRNYKDNRENYKKKYIPKKYHTPEKIGEKWQLDVKYVPKNCYVGKIPDKFYQYTVIDEATRERYIFAFKEQSSHSTVKFIEMAIKYFGYKPKEIQTDNGFEFTYFRDTKRIHSFDKFCIINGIKHKLIKPRTPRHNGKVERSHRNDNERFYKNLKFYSLKDLNYQMKRYLYRSNRIPMRPLNFLTPIQKRKELMKKTIVD